MTCYLVIVRDDGRHDARIIFADTLQQAIENAARERGWREALHLDAKRIELPKQWVLGTYRDDSFAQRDCDFCGQSYRGPAVYCSWACASADA